PLQLEASVLIFDAVGELDALRADPLHPHADFQLIPERGGRTEPDMKVDQDDPHRVRRPDARHFPQIRKAGGLQVGHVGGVVDVSMAVEITEGDFLYACESEAIHRDVQTFPNSRSNVKRRSRRRSASSMD